MLTPTKHTAASKFYEEVADLASNLYERWKSEKDHEDINDYAAPFAEAATRNGVTEIKMTRRPFGFTFKAENKSYVLKVTQRAVEYKRTA
jgi:molybdate-binding protein